MANLLSMMDISVSGDFKYFSDIDTRIRVMDKYKIDRQVLSLTAPPTIWGKLDDAQTLYVTKEANDGIYDLVQEHPDRLIAAATLPRLDGEYLDELDRCFKDLGMKAVQIFTNVNGKPLDAFEPFFERVAKFGMPVLLHPIDWQYYPWITEYRLSTIVGWPFDTTLAAMRLAFSGILERHPNLNVVTHHLGGMIPFFAERIRDFYDESIQHPDVYFGGRFRETKNLPKHPVDYLRSLYADVCVNGEMAALECGLSFFGPDRIVFATDYPFGAEYGEKRLRDHLESVQKWSISKEDKEKIMGINAARLLHLS